MLFPMYQVFSSPLGHLHFSLHFFSTLVEQLFLNHPISCQLSQSLKNDTTLSLSLLTEIKGEFSSADEERALGDKKLSSLTDEVFFRFRFLYTRRASPIGVVVIVVVVVDVAFVNVFAVVAVAIVVIVNLVVVVVTQAMRPVGRTH